MSCGFRGVIYLLITSSCGFRGVICFDTAMAQAPDDQDADQHVDEGRDSVQPEPVNFHYPWKFVSTQLKSRFDSAERSCLSKEARGILRPVYLCHDLAT
jgi:hypothetical protein